MERRTFKDLHQSWLDTQKQYTLTENTIKGTELTPIAKKNKKLELEQLGRKLHWLMDKMESYGVLGNIIEITGKINLSPKKQSLENFTLLLVNITMDEAKEYFENIVKLKYKNIVNETIEFKQLSVGILKLKIN